MPVSTLRAALAALAAVLLLPLGAAAQPVPPTTPPAIGVVTVDGALTDTPYVRLGTSAGGPSPGFGAGHEINALYAHVDPATSSLFLGVAGNVQNGNRILVFLDTKAGGFTSGNFGRTGAPGGVANFNSGTTFDVGFTPDYVLVIGTNAAGTDNFVDLFTLAGTAAGGGGSNLFIGNRADADVSADPANASLARGIEVRLTFSASGVGTDLALDRNSVQMFAAYTGESGFLSNQFITPAGTSDGNYGGGGTTFEGAAPDPVSYVFQPIAGRAGWRNLAWPVAGGTIANYATQNHVQGPATVFPSGISNVIVRYSFLGGFQNAAGSTEPLPSGAGQMWYHYDLANFPGGVVPAGSAFRPRPYTLVAGGVEPQASVQATFQVGSGFVIAGNPFSLDFDTQGITSGNGIAVGTLAYVFDPDAGTIGDYVTIDRNAVNPVARRIAPMQGVWIEAIPAPIPPAFGLAFQPTFAQASRVQSNVPLLARTAAQRVLGFHLDRLTDAGPVREWHTARLAFVDGATDGADAFDGGLPPALAADGARIAFAALTPDAGTVYRGQESRPYALAGAAEARLALLVAGRPDGATYRLTWPTTEALPAEWALTLLDGDTGATVDLGTAAHYDFTASAGEWTERFTVRVADRAVAGESAPAVARLSAPRPNPATAEARLSLTVDRTQAVRADLYDALGRRVAAVFAGTVEGERDLAVDTRGLAPGLYVLRVVGETFAESRELTVAR